MAPLDAKAHNSREGGPSFPLKHRLFRAVWKLCWLLSARWTPVPFFHGWRRFVLVAFGAKLAPTARVYPSADIWYPPNLSMGNNSLMGPGVICYCMERIEIHDDVVVSQRAHLCGGTHDVGDPDFQLLAKPIVIGRRAWIAAEAFVGPGVVVGEEAVLGARAVAFKHLEAGMIYVGNPIRLVRRRDLRVFNAEHSDVA